MNQPTALIVKEASTWKKRDVRVTIDREGLPIRVTDERLVHILDHPEMVGLEKSITQTLKDPSLVTQSLSDETTRLYYRFYLDTPVGDKFMCVVVKVNPDDAFVLTAYLTDRPKKGIVLWSKST